MKRDGASLLSIPVCLDCVWYAQFPNTAITEPASGAY